MVVVLYGHSSCLLLGWENGFGIVSDWFSSLVVYFTSIETTLATHSQQEVYEALPKLYPSPPKVDTVVLLTKTASSSLKAGATGYFQSENQSSQLETEM